ncbi:MAG: phosphate ABC transporter, permease protein PstA, partial [Anaerolineales bacterium]|nr:phosphate ABC transporter, permease protein PstA [Anaerolineales bacterium]
MHLSRYQTERIAFMAIGVAALLTVAPIIIVVGAIFVSGADAISWEFLVEMPRNGMRAGGIWPAIVGTAYLALGTGLISVPLGLGAAIYLSEYAHDTAWTRAIRLAIVNLAGIPSVVYGLFGLGLFVLFLKLGSSIVA